MKALALLVILNAVIATQIPDAYFVPYLVYCAVSGWIVADLAT